MNPDPWHRGRTRFGGMYPSSISGKGPIRPHTQQQGIRVEDQDDDDQAQR
jgi:hypothetical protein